MVENYLDTELVRLAVLFGAVISLVVYRKYGLSAGSAIVPGYLALSIVQPSHIVSTLVLSTATYVVVHKYLRPRFMFWGRELLESEIVVALAFQVLWIGIVAALTPTVPGLTLLYGIGFVLPGIIAHEMGKQGVSKTIGVTLGSTIVVFGLIAVIGFARNMFGVTVPPMEAMVGIESAPVSQSTILLLVGVCVSVLVTILLYRAPFIGVLRTGGFVTAAYLALFVNRPFDLLIIVIGSIVTYLIVTRVLMKKAILFGRNKVAAMVLTGMIVTWFAEIVLSVGFGYTPWVGFNAIALMISARLADDAQVQGPRRTLVGVAVATTIVFLVLRLF